MVRHEGILDDKYRVIYFKQFKDETFFSEEIYNYLDDGGMIEIIFNNGNLTKRIFDSGGNIIISFFGVNVKKQYDKKNMGFEIDYDYWNMVYYSGNVMLIEDSLGVWYCDITKDRKIIEKYSSNGVLRSKLIKFD